VAQGAAARVSDESDLLVRARRGDPDALRAIMRRHNRRLFRIARSVLSDEAESEDVVQETYVRAFSNLNRFEGRSSLSTWLTRIALNEAIDRKRRRRPTVELAAVEAEQKGGKLILLMSGNDGDNPEKAAALAEIRRLVEDAVDALPEIFRVAFVMRDIEDLSIDETAEHLGIKPETVKTRLHRARRLLRDRLEDRLASALIDAFPFAGARCDGMIEHVLKRLSVPS
jgi:RNA polymerase sigma-70 factor (ECF subfamily)